MRLALAGDTMLGRGVALELEKRPPQALIAAEICELTRAADLCVLNLECCISDGGEPVPKAFNFRAPPQAVETLVHIGVDCVTLANNHALDYGTEALLDTFAHLSEAGIRWAGAHDALAELAQALKAPVFLNSLARGCLPPDDPYFFSAARKYALGKADLILALGVDWDFRLGFGRRGFAPEVKVIQVDVDAVHIGRNRPVHVGIVGDPGRVIEQLVARKT